MNDLIKAKIKSIYLHPTQKVPVVFLTDEQEEVVIPMIIGFLEAQAILTAWQGLVMPRPMTVDLLKTMMEDDFEAVLDRIVIHDMREGAFLATLIVKRNGSSFERDSRPSDALALAVRTNAQIFLSQKIIDRTASENENAKAMLKFLEEESKDNDEIIKF